MENPLQTKNLAVMRLRDAAKSRDPGVKDEAASREQDHRGSERAIRCGRCGAPITSPRHRIGRAGRHLHTVFNPAGIVYEIGCFREARGCQAGGPASREFSWFAGYLWRVAFCSACAEHLGWYFSAGDDGFWGLIINRLRDE
ncbi:cereblon family protein [Desulfofustis limnaeus]|jgi:hypothetical protein|uniref:CULT domain-containing protein n=1 Tax=Desulfofustis limnaeus TaxID=2740163 RepID=A0ABN6MBH0_9BACT|nr:cereblon family protein [Desulfofustis limnaeus]MDX9896640.1 cereblon family protein [Desulfofustis sp.]BDD88832.1 hypothetical protein DPPLL_31970 [Desulfofustis limnaeus]